MVRKSRKVPAMTNVQKLKKLRVYGKFVRNLKASRKEDGVRELGNVDAYIDSKEPDHFLWSSFVWHSTPEGQAFWMKISQKLIAL